MSRDVSVGHQQMFTDPMKPLGLSIWQSTALAPMREAGGRLFVDVTPRLATPDGPGRTAGADGQRPPLTPDALETVLDPLGGGQPLADG